MGNLFSGSGPADPAAKKVVTGDAAGTKNTKKRSVAQEKTKPAQTCEKPVKISSKTSKQAATTADKSKDTAIESKTSLIKRNMKAIAGRFNKTKDASASPSKVDESESQNKPSGFQRMWNGLGIVLKVIKFVVTKPHYLPREILRILLPSISFGQMNFVLMVLFIIFGFSIYNGTSKMFYDTVEIQTNTQLKVDKVINIVEEYQKTGEKIQESLADQNVLSRVVLQGVTEIAKGASKLVGKVTTKLAEGAAQMAGDTYQSIKTLMGTWLNSDPPGDPSSESGTV